MRLRGRRDRRRLRWLLLKHAARPEPLPGARQPAGPASYPRFCQTSSAEVVA
jgi:hypothetical protein